MTLYLISPPTIISLLFLTAPYGKHHRPGWGPSLPPPLAWCLMESPTIVLTALLFPRGRNASAARGVVLMAPFFLHYTHRTLVYPLKMLVRGNKKQKQSSSKSKGFPLSVAMMAFVFNVLNGYVQVRSVSEYAYVDGDDWLWFWGVRVFIGGAVFVVGLMVNVWADNVLLGLKEKGGGGYRVPYGGLFEWVSCPNYLGEILEWLGWAVMTWSWAGLGFFLYTCANLVPRAGANHRWYLEKFGDEYPKNRKAVVPFLY